MNSSISSDTNPPAATGARSPPTAARILIPVWGERYVQQFLDLSLPTLLAPGNIPAVAAALPTEIEFLTRRRDGALLLAAPAIQRIQASCQVSVRAIDDLIVPGLHPLTITVAYARAIRALGETAMRTCFFLLVSDYVMADGSLRHVLSRIMAGASAVQAGNFRMIDTHWPAPSDLPFDDGVLRLAPRTLARMALAHLHPKTVANIVDSSSRRNDDCNQLFWQAGPDTLIGKFFLLHPICVRPERTDFAIGGFVDYSFVPEMSSPHNTVTITDSDDYLVIELQAADHEAETIRFERDTKQALARRLAEWTTSHHRDNVRATIVYHAAALPDNLPGIIAEAERFVDDVRRLLPATVQPYRAHPYWYGNLNRYKRLVGHFPAGLTAVDTSAGATSLGPRGMLVLLRQWIRHTCFGEFPCLGIAETRWPDLRRPMQLLTDVCADQKHTFLTFGAPPELNAWIAHRCHCHWLSDDGEQLDWTSREPPADPAVADDGLLFIDTTSACQLAEAISTMTTMVQPGGRLLVLAMRSEAHDGARPVMGQPGDIVANLERDFGPVEEILLVPAIGARRRIRHRMQRSTQDALSAARHGGSMVRMRTAGLLLLATVVNLWTRYRSGATLSGQRPSSIFMIARRGSDTVPVRMAGTAAAV